MQRIPPMTEYQCIEVNVFIVYRYPVPQSVFRAVTLRSVEYSFQTKTIDAGKSPVVEMITAC